MSLTAVLILLAIIIGILARAWSAMSPATQAHLRTVWAWIVARLPALPTPGRGLVMVAIFLACYHIGLLGWLAGEAVTIMLGSHHRGQQEMMRLAPIFASLPKVHLESLNEKLGKRGSLDGMATKFERDPAIGSVLCEFALANGKDINHFSFSASPVTAGSRDLTGTWRTIEEIAAGVPINHGIWKPRWEADEHLLQGALEFDPSDTSITAASRASPPFITFSF